MVRRQPTYYNQLVRAVIHGGLHKTGTTSFQLAMRHFAPLCLEHGIFYPPMTTGPGHHEWAHLAQDEQFDFVEGMVEEGRRAVGADGVILLSSEDFESLIVQPSTARTLEARLSAAGCEPVQWGFVVRDQYEYLLSLYAEMSKHGVVLELDALAEAIVRFGSVRCSNGTTRWAFVFDYEAGFRAFSAAVTGDVAVFDIADEALFPGRSVLKLTGMPDHRIDEMAAAFDRVVRPEARNARLPPSEVERNYARSLLALNGMTSQDAALTHVLAETVRLRIAAFEDARSAARRLIESRFGTSTFKDSDPVQ